MLVYDFSIFSSTLLSHVSQLTLRIFPPCLFILSSLISDRLELHCWHLLSILLAQEIFPSCSLMPVYSPVDFEDNLSLLVYFGLLFYFGGKSRKNINGSDLCVLGPATILSKSGGDISTPCHFPPWFH